jgi:hypothetical protein
VGERRRQGDVPAAADQARASAAAGWRAALGVAGLGFACRAASSTARWSRCSKKRCAAAETDPLWRASPSAWPSSCTSPPTSSGARRSARRRWPRRQLPDPATLAYVVNARHFAVWDSAEVEERLALADEAVRLAERIGDPDLALQGRTWRLMDFWEVGDVTGFDREYETYARQADARRAPKFLGFAAALRGLRLLWAARFEEAVIHSEVVLELGRRIGDRVAFMSVGIQVFLARRAQGRLAEIEPLVRAWADQAPAIPATRCMMAVLYLDLGREADARREYELLAADDFVALQRRNVLHPMLPYLAEIAVALADTRRAAILPESPAVRRPQHGTRPARHLRPGVARPRRARVPSRPVGRRRAPLPQRDRRGDPRPGPRLAGGDPVRLRRRAARARRRARAEPLRRGQAAADRLGLGPLRARLATLERIAVPQREAARAVVGGGENGRVAVSPGRDAAAGRSCISGEARRVRACGRRGRRMGSSAARASTGPSASAPTWSDCAIRAASATSPRCCASPAPRCRVDAGRRRTVARRRREPRR